MAQNTALLELLGAIPPRVLKEHFGRAALSKWRRGDRFPDVKSAKTICRIAGITLDEFYKRTGR